MRKVYLVGLGTGDWGLGTRGWGLGIAGCRVRLVGVLGASHISLAFESPVKRIKETVHQASGGVVRGHQRIAHGRPQISKSSAGNVLVAA